LVGHRGGGRGLVLGDRIYPLRPAGDRGG